MYTYDSNTVSDLHKDTYGFRPSAAWLTNWRIATKNQKQSIWDNLCADLDIELIRERELAEAAKKQFLNLVERQYEFGATDLVQAIKWIFQAEGFSLSDLRYGPSFVCYHFDLAYSEEKSFPFEQCIKEYVESTEG